MKKHILIYGVVAGVLVVALRVIEYRWLVIDHSLEIYGGLVAVIFASVGIWLGLKLTRKTVEIREVLVPVGGPVVRDEAQVEALGLTPREVEILGFMAAGLSNREIAERAFVSENTVKTHAGRVLEKLEAARRTLAIQRARELKIIR